SNVVRTVGSKQDRLLVDSRDFEQHAVLGTDHLSSVPVPTVPIINTGATTDGPFSLPATKKKDSIFSCKTTKKLGSQQATSVVSPSSSITVEEDKKSKEKVKEKDKSKLAEKLEPKKGKDDKKKIQISLSHSPLIENMLKEK